MADWKIPVSFVDGVDAEEDAGTEIRIRDLRPEVIMRLKDGVLAQRLRSIISHTYGLFIDRYVVITLNDIEVEPFPNSLSVHPMTSTLPMTFSKTERVEVELFASVATRKNGAWKGESAGWYVLCNGRIVVSADKSELTGWGVGGFPAVSQRQVSRDLSVSLFFVLRRLSRYPGQLLSADSIESLPSFKRHETECWEPRVQLSRSSIVCIKIEDDEEKVGREIADAVTPVTLSAIANSPTSTFTVRTRTRTSRPEVQRAVRCRRDQM